MHKLQLQLQKIEAHGPLIVLIARDAQNARWVVHVPFRPYFYIHADEEKLAKEKGLETEGGFQGLAEYGVLVPVVKVICDTPGEVGRRRRGFKRTWEADIPYTRRFLIDTGLTDSFEVKIIPGEIDILENTVADMGNNVLLASGPDCIVPLKEPVKAQAHDLLYDIETNKHNGSWSDKLDAMGQVTTVTFHDSYTETYTTLIWHPRLGKKGSPRTEERMRYAHAYKREMPWRVVFYGTEVEMLLGWVQYLKTHRPDGMGAWNGHQGFQRRNDGGYDTPYVITRLNKIGIGAHQLSPLGSTYAGFQGNKGQDEDDKGLWTCRVDGVQLLDLMTIYQIQEGGFTGNVPFSGLKPVAKKFAKIDMKKDPGNIEGWWENDPEEFLEYSFLDVDSIVALNMKQRYTGFARDLQRFCGVEDANIIFRPATLVGTLELRLAKRRGIILPSSATGDAIDAPDVTGGRVLDPRRWGLMNDVVVLDFNRMYVAIIQSGNIAYETVLFLTPEQQKCDHETARPLGAMETCSTCTGQADDEKHEVCEGCGFVFCPDMIRIPITPQATDHFIRASLQGRNPGRYMKGVVAFRQNVRGITPENLDYLQGLRDTYDVKIKAAKDASEKEEVKRQRTPVKSLLLTAYGAMLNSHNRLYSVDCGSAVTGLGRALHEYVDRFVCQLLGDNTAVFYGDTDSVFVAVPEGDDPISFGKWLEREINKALNEFAISLGMRKHHFRIELQEHFSKYVMGKTKKRYAGLVAWMEGVPQPIPHFLVHGLEGIKSDAAPITEEVTEKVLKSILAGVPPSDILGYIRGVYDSIMDGEMPLADIVRSVNLNFDISTTEKETNIIEAAKTGKEQYGFAYPVGSRITVIKLSRGGNWIAVPEGEDIPQGVPVDWQYHADAAVINPLKGILKWIDLGDAVASIQLGTKPTAQQKLPGM